LLGKGQFSEVYKGFFKEENNRTVAVKIIPFELLNKNPEFFSFLKRELDILKKI